MSLISDSNPAQQKAIQHCSGPQLIVAGAGTGKTRVIATRIAWLISDLGINTDEVLALTFTEKAATEMSERVENMLPSGYVDLWISTFHAFCDKLLKRHALDVGLPNDYKLLDETEAWLLVRKNLDRFNLDYYKPLGNPTKFIHALIRHFSRCKDEGIYADQYLSYAERMKLDNDADKVIKDFDLVGIDKDAQKELLKQEILRVNEVADAYHTYQQILLENDCLDFGDLINYAIKLFKDRPLILEKYRQQFKYILVDEFQDTNFVQYELIKLLSAPKNNLTVVGDDNQSIYKFRGAAITNILQFKKDFPNAAEVVLTENYRSCQPILDIAYKFIIQNTASLEKELGINKELHSNSNAKCAIEHSHYATGEDEASAVVQKIVDIKKQDEKTWSSFAVLTRANDSANVFIQELERRQIPYQFLALRGLYNKPVIVDVLSYFKLLDNYHESPAVYRVLNFKFWGIDPAQIIKLTHYSNKKTISLFETVKEAAAVPGITKETVAILNKIIAQIEKDSSAAKNKKPSEIFVNFLYQSGLLAALEKQNDQSGREDMNHLQQLFKKIQAFESSSPDPRMSEFVELIKLEQEAGEEGKLAFDVETGPDMVRIMTIHSAKGLEFDYVFLPCLVDRKFPTDERHEAIEIPDALIKENIPQGDFHLEEERRLFYVAMTRARQGLFFSSADNYGGARDKKLSRFLIELGYAKPEAGTTTLCHPEFSSGSLADRVVEEKAAPIYELPTHFSFSQMQNYEKCPLKYKFANILKIPTLGSHYFSFGTTIHNTLQKFLEQCIAAGQPDLFNQEKSGALTVLPLKKLIELYDESWVDDWYKNVKDKEAYRKKGRELLKTFYEDFSKSKPNVRMLEHAFHVKIGGYVFNGRIDRIDDAENNEVEIIDYKTGKAPKDGKLETEDKRQLLLYQIVAEELLKHKVKRLSYYYLEENKTCEFLGTEKEKIALKERFLDDIAGIKAQNFEPKPSQFVCGFCEFKDICEFKKI